MFGYALDETLGLCAMVFSATNPSAEDWEEHLRVLPELDRRVPRGGHVILVQEPGAMLPTAAVRRGLAVARAATHSDRTVLLVLPSTLQRGIVTALSWIAKPTFVEEHHATEALALESLAAMVGSGKAGAMRALLERARTAPARGAPSTHPAR